MRLIGLVASSADLAFAEHVRAALLQDVPERVCVPLELEQQGSITFGNTVPIVAIWSRRVSLAATERMAMLLQAGYAAAPRMLISADGAPLPEVLARLASDVLEQPDLAHVSRVAAAWANAAPASEPASAPAASAAAGATRPASGRLRLAGTVAAGIAVIGIGAQAWRASFAGSDEADAAPQPRAGAEARLTKAPAERAEILRVVAAATAAPIEREQFAVSDSSSGALPRVGPVTQPALELSARAVQGADVPLGSAPEAAMPVGTIRAPSIRLPALTPSVLTPLLAAPLQPLFDYEPILLADLAQPIAPLEPAPRGLASLRYAASLALPVAELEAPAPETSDTALLARLDLKTVRWD